MTIISGANFIKYEDDNILVAGEEMANSWRRYYNILLNSEHESSFGQNHEEERPIPHLVLQVIRHALMQKNIKKSSWSNRSNK